ncbi:MAG TPA: DNA replication/repair protein RecF [Stellaceae bacterium]|nr:DNA replication/repair protein RecF [Stellaceae bacterium]
MRGDHGILALPRTALAGAAGGLAPASGAAAVRRLVLTDFRGYGAARLQVTPAPVALFGPNGAGKTNLLEALSFLAPGRGLRRARLGEIDRRQKTPEGALGEPAGGAWAIHASLEIPTGTLEIGTGREASEASERRVLLVDGESAKSQAALARHLGVVWLTPAMDRLFVEGGSARRRFLDRLVYGFDAEHAQRVSAYEQAMRERARLLRDGPMDASWLAALEETMAATGIAIAAARRETVAQLDHASAEAIGAFPAARLALKGEIEVLLERLPALGAEDEMRARLKELRRQDAEAGVTLLGPHRSDLMVRHAATGMPVAEGSTGEQKALLISIVLAHARLQAALKGRAPLLLLDEVAAHLDPARRGALFGEILRLGAQAWLTGTDAALFEGLRGRAQFFSVADAALAPA